jgi:hypothetical protein
MGRIRVLNPQGVPRTDAFGVPALPDDLRGLTVGFLDNTKANFDRLTREMGELLRARAGVRAIVHRKKANASTPAPPELIADMAKTCDLVFAGSAD